MQTKRKRKQWALLAFTMIATFVLQIITPLTASAEEKTYTSTFSVEHKEISDRLGTCYDYKFMHNVTANKPYKIAVLYHDVPERDYYSRFTAIMYLVDDISDISFTMNVLCEDNCDVKHNCKHSGSYNEYDETSFTTYYDNDGNVLCYGLVRWFEDYDQLTKPNYDGVHEFLHNIVTVNNATYISDIDTTDNGTYAFTNEDYENYVKQIYNGSIRPNGQFDESTAIYDTNIPTPNITVKNDYSFGFNNDSDGYYFQVKGRWYSVDDIELFKQNFQWKYKYHSYVKSNLTDWVTTNEKASTSMQDLNFAKFGKTAFDSFLSYYPLDNRSYSGSTEIRGYNDAINTIKMLLKVPESIYNGLEVYIRYYTFDENGVAHYGKWCHYYDNLANASGSSGSQWDDKENMFTGNQSQDGLTDSQFGELENTDNSRNDIDVTPEYNDDGFDSIILGDMDTTSLVTALESMYGQTKTFISMIGLVFNFLPPWIVTLICTSLGLVCVIGIWKCIRG